MNRRFIKLAFVLGLITAVGPLAIDMYLPALPLIGIGLGATPVQVQLSLTIFFVVLGACQLFYGPLSDLYGRKRPIYMGLTLFTVASIGCALATDVSTLIEFRILQAVGACAGMVVPRAIVRDMHTGHEAARLISLLMLILSASPILAPSAGTIVISMVGWRGIFWVLSIAGGLSILLAVFGLKEATHVNLRVRSSWIGAWKGYGALMRDGPFLGLTFVGALGMSSFFVYLSNASFVLGKHYGVTPTIFSFCFSLNAVAFFGASQFTAPLSRAYGMPRLIRVSAAAYAFAMSTLAILFLAGAGGLAIMMVCLFVGYGFLGLVLPTAAVLTLENHGTIAGTASALMGALQFVVGAIAMALSSIFVNGDPRAMVVCIALASVSSFALAHFTLGARNLGNQYEASESERPSRA